MIILYAVPISLWPTLGKENRFFIAPLRQDSTKKTLYTGYPSSLVYTHTHTFNPDDPSSVIYKS